MNQPSVSFRGSAAVQVTAFPEYPPVESAAVCGQFLQLRGSPRRPERAGPDRRYGDQRPLGYRLQNVRVPVDELRARAEGCSVRLECMPG